MPPVPRQTPVGSSRRFAHLSLRLLLLLIGMFTAALGVALTTVADLGTTPISTVPYAFTVLTGYSFGTTTFFVNLFLVAGQVLLLRRRFSLWNLLQIPTVLIFGICIDLAMAIVSPHAPAGWWTGLLMSISGNFVLALGIVMQIRSKTIVQPGEGFVLAAAAVTRKSFGSIKIVNDVTLSLIAAGIGLVCAGELIGVREGTVLSAVLVGLFAKLIVKFVDRLGVFVQAGAAAIQEPQPPQPHESAITAIQTSEENNDRSQTNVRPLKIANNKLLTNSRSYCLSALSKVIFTCFIKVSKDY
ncbi:MAG: YczE/YyaS/YitT family protein [Sutterella wadsworthensis]